MKVSVVMATYNGLPYLDEQLRSIDAQSRLPDEIIILDDCSQDGTWEYLQQYGLKNARAKVLRNESNAGVNASFMRALSLADGDVVFFADQDDVWGNEKIERMLKAWAGESLVYSNAIVVNEGGAIKHCNELEFHGVVAIEGRNPWFFLGCNCVSGHNAMVTKRLVQYSRCYAPKGVMYDQWLALLASMLDGVKYMPDFLCWHRMHSRNANNNPELRVGKHKGRGWKEKRKRFYEKRNAAREMVVALSSYEVEGSGFRRTIHLMIEHYANLEKLFFNWGLFFHLIRRRRLLFPGLGLKKSVRRARNLSLGGRAFWLP